MRNHMIKRLWLYRYDRGGSDVLHTVYAVDETEAWAEIRVWKQDISDSISSETLELAPPSWGWANIFEKGTLLCEPDGTPLESPSTYLTSQQRKDLADALRGEDATHSRERQR